MRDSSALDAAQAFLNVVWAEAPPNDAKLIAGLDRLLAAAHDVPEAEAEDTDGAPPESDWSSTYRELATRFPDYGFYAVASPLAVGETALLTGDAIDDLADLTRDLREVIWRGEHISSGDAAWYFRLMYEAHWGRHARELALFLHARLSDALD